MFLLGIQNPSLLSNSKLSCSHLRQNKPDSQSSKYASSDSMVHSWPSRRLFFALI